LRRGLAVYTNLPNLQGQGLGRLLLADAVTRSRNAALSVGSAGIFVDAQNADAVRFYKRYGFIAGHAQPHKLYLPMWCPPDVIDANDENHESSLVSKSWTESI